MVGRAMWVAVLCLLPSLATSLEITSPAEVAQSIRSPIFNYRIGPQKFLSSPNITASLFATDMDNACDEDATSVDGHIVALEIASVAFDIPPVKDMRDRIECLEAMGAVGVVMPRPDGKTAGYLYHLTNSRFTNTVSIPVVTTAGNSMTKVIDFWREEGVDVVVRLMVDENPFEETWDSPAFIAFWLVLFPAINAYGLFISLRGAARRLPLLKADPDPFNNKTNALMMFGSFVEAASCGMRICWCFVGPMLSDHILLTHQHFVFISVPVALEIATNLLAVDLFLRWGAFKSFSKHNAMIERMLVAVVVFSVIAVVTLITVTAVYGLSNDAIVLSYSLALASMLPTIVIFLRQGQRIVRKLRGTGAGKQAQTSEKRRQATARAINWIMTSALVQIVSVASILFMICGAMFYPWPFFSGMVLLMLSQTLGAVASAQAFSPYKRPSTRQQRRDSANGSQRRNSVESDQEQQHTRPSPALLKAIKTNNNNTGSTRSTKSGTPTSPPRSSPSCNPPSRKGSVSSLDSAIVQAVEHKRWAWIFGSKIGNARFSIVAKAFWREPSEMIKDDANGGPSSNTNNNNNNNSSGGSGGKKGKPRTTNTTSRNFNWQPNRKPSGRSETVADELVSGLSHGRSGGIQIVVEDDTDNDLPQDEVEKSGAESGDEAV